MSAAEEPVWSDWVRSGRLPTLPKGWEWSHNTLEAIDGDLQVDHLDAASLDVYCSSWDSYGGSVPLTLVAALVEARKAWVEAGGWVPGEPEHIGG